MCPSRDDEVAYMTEDQADLLQERAKVGTRPANVSLGILLTKLKCSTFFFLCSDIGILLRRVRLNIDYIGVLSHHALVCQYIR